SLTSEDSDIYYNFLHFCSLTSETFLENFSEYVKPKNKKSEFVFIPLGKENHRKSREFVSLSVAFKK
ncbi:MAG: hypothetical protein NZZ41_07935, partial [Candidatus Dojkabacteria bacterium]|nr:hypothetical protein [Candidatus Dojkabacteria bacterium]